MQFNQATDYAFRIILYLASLPVGVIVNGQKLAEHECIPQGFLLKIMRTLTKKGIINSHRGVEGGFSLAVEPSGLSLLTIVEAMEGTVAINRCLCEKQGCNKPANNICPVHKTLAQIQDKLILALKDATFDKLAKEII